MSRERLLVVSPYPIVRPLHGGQKRVQALVERYSELADVHIVAVYQKDAFDEAADNDIMIETPEIYSEIEQSAHRTEVILAEALQRDTAVKDAFVAQLRAYRPTIIHVEQPYFMKAVTEILAELGLHPLIIFGSQNVEWKMKEQIYTDKLEATELKKFIDSIRIIEREALQLADVTYAVSGDDARQLKELCHSRVFVVANGASVPAVNASEGRWSDYKRQNQLRHILAFIGSAHPPNVTGYKQLIQGLKLDDTTRVVVAGSVSKLIDEETDGIVVAGIVSDDELNNLLSTADSILLPIVSGGGSNLKTAEAILSGKKVIATEFAFRGFEKLQSLPTVYIASNQSEFQAQIEAASEVGTVTLSKREKRLASKVTWGYSLRSLGRILFYLRVLRLFLKRA